MRSRTFTASVSAVLLFTTSIVEAKHSHGHLHALFGRHQSHREQHRSTPKAGKSGVALSSPNKRGGKGDQCQFPYDAGLVPVTPHEENAGWAMSPDQPCLPGSYCPYACPPGQVSMQWDPTATYTYPASMNGGLYCNQAGMIEKPIPDQPYCRDAKCGIGALNEASGQVSFCQTVLPGNEAMLIPTNVGEWAELAVPGTDYWCSTAAHYYINPPGVGPEEACVWGTKDKPVGNWSPYVAGANVNAKGESFIKLGWNPIYLEPETPFRDEMPTWGVKIECDGPGCNGLPCAIDPAKNKVNEMIGSSSVGAGAGAFCVVTVPKNVNANFVVFDGSGGAPKGGANGENHDADADDSETAAEPTSAPESVYESEYISFTSSSASWSESALSTEYDYSTTADVSRSSPAPSPMYSPHEFFENSTATDPPKPAGVTVTASTSPIAPTGSTTTGAASRAHLSIASLAMGTLVLFVLVTLSS